MVAGVVAVIGIVCVGAAALGGPAAGGAPAATLVWLTTTSFRSRDAMAFDTSAHTTAAAIKVAASRKCFLQFIECETNSPRRMLRHQSTRRSTIIECDS